MVLARRREVPSVASVDVATANGIERAGLVKGAVPFPPRPLWLGAEGLTGEGLRHPLPLGASPHTGGTGEPTRSHMPAPEPPNWAQRDRVSIRAAGRGREGAGHGAAARDDVQAAQPGRDKKRPDQAALVPGSLLECPFGRRPPGVGRARSCTRISPEGRVTVDWT
jgi:hypothetical protein